MLRLTSTSANRPGRSWGACSVVSLVGGQHMPKAPASAAGSRLGRQGIKRWGIDPRSDSATMPIISFRPFTLWQAYRNAVVGALTLSILPPERAGRVTGCAGTAPPTHGGDRRAEAAYCARARIHASPSPANSPQRSPHEINPTAGRGANQRRRPSELILQAGGDRREELLRIVGRIRNDTKRARAKVHSRRTAHFACAARSSGGSPARSKCSG